MANQTFAADIRKFAGMAMKDMRAVAQQSIQDVVQAAQTPQLGMTKGNPSFEVGKIPVAEGDLIKSLASGLNGAFGPEGQDSYAVVIAGLELGDTARFAWTAAHARPIEMGWTTSKGNHVPGRHFVGANAARFQEFVEKNVARVKAR